MSSQYPILDNRPINKWKVAELKEELKRRNLTTKGLKDELVNRLDEAIRMERESIEAEEGKGFVGSSEPVGNLEATKISVSGVHTGDEPLENKVYEVNKVDEDMTGMEIDDCPTEIGQVKALEQEATSEIDPSAMVGEPEVPEAALEIHHVQDEVVLPQIISSEGVLDNRKSGKDDEALESFQRDAILAGEAGDLEAAGLSSGKVLDDRVTLSMKILEDNKTEIANQVEGKELPSSKAVEDNEIKPDNKSVKSSEVEAESNDSNSSEQVYEVSTNLGLKVKNESFSTDTLINNEKNELKDNINADNFQLETEIVRQEMVQPSFGRDPPGDGILHPFDESMLPAKQTLDGEIDDDKSEDTELSKINDNAHKVSVDIPVVGHNLENEASKVVEYENEPNKMAFAKDMSPVSGLSPEKLEPSTEEKDDVAASKKERRPQAIDDNDFGKAIDVTDGELLEKVNFDQSSADDSMEDDASETKQVESDHNSSKVDEKFVSEKKPGVGEGGRIDVMHQITPSDKLKSSSEHVDSVTAISGKRKFQDATEAANIEPPKRQRRWNAESQKVPESQSGDASLSTKPKASFQTASARPNLSGSNSTLTGETPKERVVPLSQKTPTTSLRIDHFLRPFTLKAVQELLAKTGNVCSFWMDHIKTHCYVMYSSIEEAIETRNAVYNLQWPPNGGRLLIADFVDPEEVKLRLEAPSQFATPSVNTSTQAVTTQLPPQPAPPTHQPRQQQEPPNPLSRQPPARDPSAMRDQLPKAPLPVAEKVDTPTVTLDDLFRKTRATPQIYYLPLTDELVAAKVARQKRSRQ